MGNCGFSSASVKSDNVVFSTPKGFNCVRKSFGFTHAFRIGNTLWSTGSSQSLIGVRKNGAVLRESFVQICNCFRPGGEKIKYFINGIGIKHFGMCHINMNFSSYHPQTKLRENNVFTGVCLHTGGISGPMSFLGVSLVPGRFQGWVDIQGVGIGGQVGINGVSREVGIWRKWVGQEVSIL